MFLTKKKYAIITVLLFAILIRFFIFGFEKEHLVNYWDSIDYGRIASRIITTWKISEVINALRPPLYPILIAGSFITNNTYPDENSVYAALKENSGLIIVIIQILVGIISVLVFYLLVLELFRPSIALAIGIFYAIHPLVFPWDIIILTESLSFSLLIIYFFAVVYLFKKVSLFRLTIVTILGILLLWLRSSYIFVLPITLILMALYSRSWKILIKLYFFGFLFLVPIIFQIRINEINYGYKTFQVAGEINLFGRMMYDDYKIPIIPNNLVSEWMQKKFVLGENFTPFPILEDLDQNFYYNKKIINDMKEYTFSTLINNFPQYILNVLSDVPQLFRVAVGLPKSPAWFQKFQLLCIYIQAFTSVLLVFLPFVLRKMWFKRKFRTALTALTGIIILYIYSTSLFFGYIDAWRYGTTAIPLLLIYSGGLLEIYGRNVGLKITSFIRSK